MGVYTSLSAWLRSVLEQEIVSDTFMNKLLMSFGL